MFREAVRAISDSVKRGRQAEGEDGLRTTKLRKHAAAQYTMLRMRKGKAQVNVLASQCHSDDHKGHWHDGLWQSSRVIRSIRH